MAISPRREWKSFLLDAKCAVKWAMRALNIAIWTSQEPVSLSSKRYSLIIACLSIDLCSDIFLFLFTRIFGALNPRPASPARRRIRRLNLPLQKVKFRGNKSDCPSRETLFRTKATRLFLTQYFGQDAFLRASCKLFLCATPNF